MCRISRICIPKVTCSPHADSPIRQLPGNNAGSPSLAVLLFRGLVPIDFQLDSQFKPYMPLIPGQAVADDVPPAEYECRCGSPKARFSPASASIYDPCQPLRCQLFLVFIFYFFLHLVCLLL